MAAFGQPLQKGANQIARATARTIIQNVHEQSKETLKDVREQVTGQEIQAAREGTPEVVQHIKEEGSENVDREQIRAYEQTRIADLERQLQEIAEKNRKQRESNLAATSQLMQTSSATETPAEGPQGKQNKKGAFGKLKQKVQSILSTRKQSETKQGAGKG